MNRRTFLFHLQNNLCVNRKLSSLLLFPCKFLSLFRAVTKVAVFSILFSLLSFPVLAGTISLKWDPVADSDLAGYKIYYGTAPGSYHSSKKVGRVTSYTLEGLSECTRYYLVVSAYDTSGNESAFSNEVNGMPRPIVLNVAPFSAEKGRRLTVMTNGHDFEDGAILKTDDLGITIHSTSFITCNQLYSDITITETALEGLHDFTVENPDGIQGSGIGVFEVEPVIFPEVISSTPSDGQEDIPADVQPEIEFSESIDEGTVSSDTIMLIDSNGGAVAQTSDSPLLRRRGRRIVIITPLDKLEAGSTYKIKVIGGVGGIKDLAGHAMDGDFIQQNGFTVIDTAPPVLSAVSASDVLTTSADINWNSDEPADSLVEYKPRDSSYFRQTEIDLEMVTAHKVSLIGLEPDTLYDYHVTSRDGSGNSSTSEPDKSFQTDPSPFSYLYIEAEEGELVEPLKVGTEDNPPAFLDKYLYTPRSSGYNDDLSIGKGSYEFYAPSDGFYRLWIRIYAPFSNHTSFWVRVNSGEADIVASSFYGSWEWVQGPSYYLGEGLHLLELIYRDGQVRADRMIFTDDTDFTPVESPGSDRTSPSPVQYFSASPDKTTISLSWTNPPEADFQKTIIRYRADGISPKHPEDGFPVCGKQGEPLSSDGCLHEGLKHKETYYYSAFAVDGDRNISEESTSSASTSDAPPGPPQNNKRSDTK